MQKKQLAAYDHLLHAQIHDQNKSFQSQHREKTENKSSYSHTTNFWISNGNRTTDLPDLVGFSFRELPLPDNYHCPLETYASFSFNQGFSLKLYLPKHIFVLDFKFNCSNYKTDALPKVTTGQTIAEEEIDKQVSKKLFFFFNKGSHEKIKRRTTEYILNIADLPLLEYLQTYGKGLKNVSEFLAIYQVAERKFETIMDRDEDLAVKRTLFS